MYLFVLPSGHHLTTLPLFLPQIDITVCKHPEGSHGCKINQLLLLLYANIPCYNTERTERSTNKNICVLQF